MPLIYFARYLTTILNPGKYQGDYLNDWLSRVPHQTAALWEVMGHALALTFGL